MYILIIMISVIYLFSKYEKKEVLEEINRSYVGVKKLLCSIFKEKKILRLISYEDVKISWVILFFSIITILNSNKNNNYYFLVMLLGWAGAVLSAISLFNYYNNIYKYV